MHSLIALGRAELRLKCLGSGIDFSCILEKLPSLFTFADMAAERNHMT